MSLAADSGAPGGGAPEMQLHRSIWFVFHFGIVIEFQTVFIFEIQGNIKCHFNRVCIIKCQLFSTNANACRA